jgi:diguanylate cyclase (GGDEF)-like protein
MKMSEIAKPKAKRAKKRERAQAVLAQGGNRLQHRIRELELTLRQHVNLRKLSSYLKASLTPAEAYAAVECFGPQLFEGTTGKLYLIHPPGDYLEHVATWGDASPNEGTFTFWDCWALRRAQPHWVRDTRAEPLCGHVAPVSKSVLPYLCVPLIPQGKLQGLLHVRRLKIESGSSQDIGSLESSLNLASNVAEEVGLALANLNLRETLHEQSIRDPLTGLYNRRFLEDSLIRELSRARRKTHPLSIILLDIDHFKRVNDTFGHGAGDMVLRRLGLVLQAYVRESDIACRVGGEEFSVLLPEGPLQIATQRAEDIRKAVNELTLKHEEQDLGTVTVSLGVATFPDHGTTADALIRAADQVLYDAKRKGRNRVVSASARKA